jgi:hypothetical protein
MDQKPQRRFRFGLIALFALIAAVGVLVSLWNPFPKPSRSNFGLIEEGMTEADVAVLVGKPDRVEKDNLRLAHLYELGVGEAWLVFYQDGRVLHCGNMFYCGATPDQ